MSHGLYIQPKREISIGTYLIWAAVITLLAVCAWYGYRFYMNGEQPPVPLAVASAKQDVEETPVDETDVIQHKVSESEPRTISIPSLDIEDSRVLPVGLGKNGEPETPTNVHDTGWYNKSAQPGDLTSALLVNGHSAGPSQDGVFKQLPKLTKGSDIVIERGDGELFTYEVHEVKVVTLSELQRDGMKALSASIDPVMQGLNIMSPTGNWIPAKETYDKRVVVRAALKS